MKRVTRSLDFNNSKKPLLNVQKSLPVQFTSCRFTKSTWTATSTLTITCRLYATPLLFDDCGLAQMFFPSMSYKSSKDNNVRDERTCWWSQVGEIATVVVCSSVMECMSVARSSVDCSSMTVGEITWALMGFRSGWEFTTFAIVSVVFTAGQIFNATDGRISATSTGRLIGSDVSLSLLNVHDESELSTMAEGTSDVFIRLKKCWLSIWKKKNCRDDYRQIFEQIYYINIGIIIGTIS